ncbi:hypothetical protein AAZX31_17G227900 [Glycine max]
MTTITKLHPTTKHHCCTQTPLLPPPNATIVPPPNHHHHDHLTHKPLRFALHHFHIVMDCSIYNIFCILYYELLNPNYMEWSDTMCGGLWVASRWRVVTQ